MRRKQSEPLWDDADDDDDEPVGDVGTATTPEPPAATGAVTLDLDRVMLGVQRLRRRRGGNAGVLLEMLLEQIGSDALTRETRLARREAGEA